MIKDKLITSILHIRCPDYLLKIIDKIRKEENRNRVNMAQTLWIEALEHRGELDRTHTKAAKK